MLRASVRASQLRFLRQLGENCLITPVTGRGKKDKRLWHAKESNALRGAGQCLIARAEGQGSFRFRRGKAAEALSLLLCCAKKERTGM